MIKIYEKNTNLNIPINTIISDTSH
jgi:hypothetical protein